MKLRRVLSLAATPVLVITLGLGADVLAAAPANAVPPYPYLLDSYYNTKAECVAAGEAGMYSQWDSYLCFRQAPDWALYGAL